MPGEKTNQGDVCFTPFFWSGKTTKDLRCRVVESSNTVHQQQLATVNAGRENEPKRRLLYVVLSVGQDHQDLRCRVVESSNTVHQQQLAMADRQRSGHRRTTDQGSPLHRPNTFQDRPRADQRPSNIAPATDKSHQDRFPPIIQPSAPRRRVLYVAHSVWQDHHEPPLSRRNVRNTYCTRLSQTPSTDRRCAIIERPRQGKTKDLRCCVAVEYGASATTRRGECRARKRTKATCPLRRTFGRARPPRTSAVRGGCRARTSTTNIDYVPRRR